ncbi:General transcription and DNA repair factor IIH subunit TFB1 [Pseudozyma hubeiensis]|nr:General transcription and DNA repair factor IIH subunit TFB1 [Pseudozyma hubeiensis]
MTIAFNKVAGTLSLHSDSTLQWTPSSSTSGVSAFHIKFVDIAGLQTSKPGAAQIALMLVLANGVQIASKPKVLLVFNAAQQTALEDREKFKTELAAAVGRNRASIDGVATPGTPGSPAPITSSALATRAATPETPAPATTTGSTRPPSETASPAPAAPTSRSRKAIPPAKTDIELRISVIKSNPSLRALHKDIVISGAMSDSEFWSHPHRQRLIRAERAKLEQRAGRNARLADPKPTPNEAGEMKLSITPELIRDLFEQFPVVARAYEENVPSKLDEGSFWTRYFQSRLYHRLRTSARSAASEHIVMEDPIFDAYLEEEDDGLEPRRKANVHDRLLDLGATEEDHGETGNGKDWTMRGGAERRTLPLMRRFNDHSKSLLDDALGEQEEGMARRVVGGVGEEYGDDDGGKESEDWIKNHYYKDIVIDDLNEEEETDKRRLSVKNLEGYFEGSQGESTAARTTDAEVMPTSVAEYLDYVDKFNASLPSSIALGSFRPQSSGSQASMARMLSNLRSRSINPKSASSDLKTLPEPTQKAVTSLQASTTEFLRQFWNSIAPTTDDNDADGGGTWNAISFTETEERRREVEENRLVQARKMALNLVKFRAKFKSDTLTSYNSTFSRAATTMVAERIHVCYLSP